MSQKQNFSRILRSLLVLGTLLPFAASAQEEAVTSSGKVVILNPDNTWAYKAVAVDTVEADSSVVAEVTSDSTSSPAPKKAKGYTENSTGFQGFLKPEIILPTLPERADGVYQFRVKINKEGFVKEVVTVVRGPHGQAEQLMRNTITKLKYLPDGSLVPNLTEGIIKISVGGDGK
jgi:hypothetical protein